LVDTKDNFHRKIQDCYFLEILVAEQVSVELYSYEYKVYKILDPKTQHVDMDYPINL